jgi:hypothetical protein
MVDVLRVLLSLHSMLNETTLLDSLKSENGESIVMSEGIENP